MNAWPPGARAGAGREVARSTWASRVGRQQLQPAVRRAETASAIGRALINRPSTILADEPTGNLDTSNTDTVYQLFRDINRQQGTGPVRSSKAYASAKPTCDVLGESPRNRCSSTQKANEQSGFPRSSMARVKRMSNATKAQRHSDCDRLPAQYVPEMCCRSPALPVTGVSGD